MTSAIIITKAKVDLNNYYNFRIYYFIDSGLAIASLQMKAAVHLYWL